MGKTSAAGQPAQAFILFGIDKRVPALIGCDEGGNVTSAGWQVILCDPIRRVSFRSSEASVNCYMRLLTLLFTL